ncbi:MAG: hypothetical protein ABT940_14370 [Alphaproteobacteria bacterium]
MSDGTVRRYELVGDGEYWSMQAMDEGDYMLYDDHKAIADALRTQARELATFVRANTLLTDNLNQIAQAVLKEGR